MMPIQALPFSFNSTSCTMFNCLKISEQGHDHVHHCARDRGCGEVGQGHVVVNGIVKDEGRGEIIRCFSLRTKTWMGRRKINCQGEGGRTEERNIWYLVRCYIQSGDSGTL